MRDPHLIRKIHSCTHIDELRALYAALGQENPEDRQRSDVFEAFHGRAEKLKSGR